MAHDELLRRIRDQPDDDELRSVFADALEQAGDLAWAELVRKQLAGQDAGALIGEHGRRIAGAIADHVASWKFSRGLIAAIETDPIRLAASLDEVLGTMPIQTITFVDPDARDDHLPSIERIANSPHLGRIRTIHDHGLGDRHDEPDGLRVLLESPYLAALEDLTLDRICNAASARVIGEAHARLARLDTLHFENAESQDFGDDGATAIGESPLCARLTDLLIVGGWVSSEGVATIASGARDLRVLVLASTWYARNPIGERGARALASAAGLAGLEHLDVAGGGIEAGGARALAEATWIERVRDLDLTDNGLADTDLLSIVDRATSLTRLHVESGLVHGAPANRISKATLQQLRERSIEIVTYLEDDDG